MLIGSHAYSGGWMIMNVVTTALLENLNHWFDWVSASSTQAVLVIPWLGSEAREPHLPLLVTVVVVYISTAASRVILSPISASAWSTSLIEMIPTLILP